MSQSMGQSSLTHQKPAMAPFQWEVLSFLVSHMEIVMRDPSCRWQWELAAFDHLIWAVSYWSYIQMYMYILHTFLFLFSFCFQDGWFAITHDAVVHDYRVCQAGSHLQSRVLQWHSFFSSSSNEANCLPFSLPLLIFSPSSFPDVMFWLFSNCRLMEKQHILLLWPVFSPASWNHMCAGIQAFNVLPLIISLYVGD